MEWGLRFNPWNLFCQPWIAVSHNRKTQILVQSQGPILHRNTIHRARERHINFEHISFLKVGTTLGQPARITRGKCLYFLCSEANTWTFWPVNPGTTSHLSQGHLDVNQSKSLCLRTFFLPEYKWVLQCHPPNYLLFFLSSKVLNSASHPLQTHNRICTAPFDPTQTAVKCGWVWSSRFCSTKPSNGMCGWNQKCFIRPKLWKQGWVVAFNPSLWQSNSKP